MATEPLKLITASVVSFERKLDPSDALFFSGQWNDIASTTGTGHWPAVMIREKSVRGSISNRLKAKDQDPAKFENDIKNANLQTVDVATLPSDSDTLKVVFSLRVQGNVDRPSSCNGADYQRKLQATVKGYVNEHGFGELAKRYAFNLANGRFLWRNRLGVEQAEVQVAHLVRGVPAQTWTFDALALSMSNFEVPSDCAESLSQLGGLIANGLAGSSHVLLQVTAYVRMGFGQEVFPSQELILTKKSAKSKTAKSKTLAQINGVASMHSQKLGNALRSIDTWYVGAEHNGPISVEPYGSVTTQGMAYRQPKQKQDFYSLFDAWITKDKVPALEQQHFVIATLIRGGVFGEKEKE